jgi:hypothetical protein
MFYIMEFVAIIFGPNDTTKRLAAGFDLTAHELPPILGQDALDYTKNTFLGHVFNQEAII